MSTLKVGIHVVPIEPDQEPRTPSRENIAVIDHHRSYTVEAELLDINPRFCRLRIARDHFRFDPGKVSIQFVWTNLVARIVWTNTGDDSVELGLMMPRPDDVS